jgi:O-antigen ligase
MYLVSTIVSPNFEYSLKRFFYIFTIFSISIFNFVLLNSFFSNKICKAEYIVSSSIKISLFISFVFGIAQYIFPHLAYREEVRFLFGLSFQRVNSYFPDPNFYAAFIICSNSFIVFYECYKFKVLKFSTVFLIIPLSIIFLFLTGSRGAFISWIFSSVFLFMFFNSNVKVRRILAIFCIFILPLSLILYNYLNFITNIESIKRMDDQTLSAFSRLLSWYSGITLWLDSPVFGVGPGNYITQDKGDVLNGFVETWRATQINTLAAHSNIIELLVEAGVGPVFCYLMIFYKSISNFVNGMGPLCYASLSILINFFVCTLFLSYFTPWIFFYFGVLLFSYNNQLRN